MPKKAVPMRNGSHHPYGVLTWKVATAQMTAAISVEGCRRRRGQSGPFRYLGQDVAADAEQRRRRRKKAPAVVVLMAFVFGVVGPPADRHRQRTSPWRKANG